LAFPFESTLPHDERLFEVTLPCGRHAQRDPRFRVTHGGSLRAVEVCACAQNFLSESAHQLVLSHEAVAVHRVEVELCRVHDERWNLGQRIRDKARTWSDVCWDDLDPDEDPRLLFGLAELTFGTRNGLWPIAGTDRGETLFLVAAHGTAPWLLVEDGEGGWARYDMSFAEWLYRYFIGEDMAGPNSAVFYPGPVQLCRLPMSADERPEPWSGPDRGM
jgi:hypothetical protein